MENNMEMEVPVVLLEDDLGNEQEFEILDVLEYMNEEYVVLLPTDDEADEVVILKVESLDDEEETYVGLDDDELINNVFEVFKDRHKDEFDF